jgi:hypothetical protein
MHAWLYTYTSRLATSELRVTGCVGAYALIVLLLVLSIVQINHIHVNQKNTLAKLYTGLYTINVLTFCVASY